MTLWGSLTLSLALLSSIHVVGAEIPSGVALSPHQELVINNVAEPASLDPHKTLGSPEASIMANLFEGLASFDPRGEIVPGVAVRWESTPDFKRWTLYLRTEASWSNGEPLTAHDFVYSWQRLADPETAAPYVDALLGMRLENIDEIVSGKQPSGKLGICAIDDHTLQLSLSSPVPYLSKMLANFPLYPIHQATVEKFGDKWTSPANWVGNGAYKIDKWLVNERIVLLRNKNYWDNLNMVIDKVTFLPLSSDESAVKRYLAGEIDITGRNLPTELFKEFKHTMAEEVQASPRLALYFYEFNIRQAPFNDPRVRRALSLVLNREWISSSVLGQGQLPAYTFNSRDPKGFQPHPVVWSSWEPQQRQVEARKLLQEAGYGEEKPLKFTLSYDNSEYNKKIALAAAAMWRETLGAEVRLEGQEWRSFMENRAAAKLQMSALTWFSDYNEPSSFLNILISNSSVCTSGYSSQYFDDLMLRSLSATTVEERYQIYQAAEDQLMLDLPIIPLFHVVTVRLVKPDIGGYRCDNPMRVFYMKDLYRIKR